ncbi:hypothetical protein N0V85_008395, partial [Neurospora sp. IMI 360204]
MSVCKACEEPLYLEVDPDYDLDQDSDDDGGPSSSSSHPSGQPSQPQQVPDDLLLPCNCHYHWQCLMDLSSSVALSLRCPSCNTYLPTNSSSSGSSNPVPVSAKNPILPTSSGIQILTQYHNEGGLQSSLDILPTLTEEAYLSSNPSARPARAMHTMASEGDFAGIIELLTDVAASDPSDEDGGAGITPSELLTFRDPLNEGKTALHLAVENGREE